MCKMIVMMLAAIAILPLITDAASDGPDALSAKKLNVSRPIFSQLVVHGIPKGWKTGFEKTMPARYIQEFVPATESVESWSEMITVQGLKDMSQNPNMTPKALLSMVAGGIKKTCGESFIGQAVGEHTVDSYEAYSAIIGCGNMPANRPTGIKQGQGEVALYVAIKGTRDIYVIQRAVRTNAFDPARSPITVPRIAELIRDVQPIKICDLNVSQFTCWDRAPR